MSGSTSHYPPGYLEEYRGNRLIAVSISFIVLDILFVALRFYTRRTANSSIWGWDDNLLVPALIANIGMCALGIVFVKVAGVGHHLAAVSPATLHKWAQCLYSLSWIYLTAVLLPRMSILFTYLRVFTAKSLRQVTYALMAIAIAFYLAYGFAVTFQCDPVSYAWNKGTPGAHGTCFDVKAFYKTINPPIIVTDLIMIALPIPMVWRLQTTRLRKFGLTFAFMAGSVGTAASCARLAVFCNTDPFEDNTWNSVSLVAWSIVEPSMYLIAACLPTLRPLVSQVSPAWLKAFISSKLSVDSSPIHSIKLESAPEQHRSTNHTRNGSGLSGSGRRKDPPGHDTIANADNAAIREPERTERLPSAQRLTGDTIAEFRISDFDIDRDLERGKSPSKNSIF